MLPTPMSGLLLKSIVITVGAAMCTLSSSVTARASDDQGWQSYGQVRYTDSQDKGDYLSIRRLKLFGGGWIGGNWSYYTQLIYKTGNLSSTDDRIFVQDLNATLNAPTGALTIGQFKPPFGMERFEPDWRMPLVDRAQVSDRLIPNGSVGDSFARDVGVQWQTNLQNGLNYTVAIFGGNGANEPFVGNGPLMVVRGVYDQPGAGERFHAEAAVSWRRDHDIDFRSQSPGAPAGYAAFAGEDARLDLSLAYDWSGNSLRGEYIAAQYLGDMSSIPDIDADGFYIQFAREFSKHWQGAIRYEELNATQADLNHGLAWTTLGATYRIHSDYEKVQINYVFRRERPVEIGNNALIVQYQRFLW